MKKQFHFTNDYLEGIANAGIFSFNQHKTIINADDMLLGIFLYSKKFSFHTMFWELFGFDNVAILQQYIDKHFPSLHQEYKDVKFQLDMWFRTGFDQFSAMGITTLNVLSLLYMSLDAISDDLFAYLETHGVVVQKSKEKTLHLIKLTNKADIPLLKFFEMFATMTKKLGMNFADAEVIMDIDRMMIDLDTDENLVMMSGDDQALQDRDEKSSDKKSTSDKLTIEYYATELTGDEVKSMDPVIGRDTEIMQMIYTLLRKTKNNPLLIWEAWVGKTALVEWLAQRIASGDVPTKLQWKRLFMLDVAWLVAGTKYRWEFEARLKAIIEEAMDIQNNIIIFIDEIHTIIWAWSAEGTGDAANILKPALARGKIQLIWATTFDEYQKYIEKDPALKRRFQELAVDEPTKAVAIEILEWLKSKYEDFHGVVIESEAIYKAVDYSVRYMMNKHLPDKAIDLIDEACARQSTLHQKLEKNKEYEKATKDITAVQSKIQKAIQKQDYFTAAELKEKEEILKQKLMTLRSVHNLPNHLRPKVTVEHINTTISQKMGIPLEQVSSSEVKKLGQLESHLKQFIQWQDEAIAHVVKAIKRNRISVVEKNQPIASFLFLWPSGVGKTYLAKLLAKEYFADEKALIRVDMSEYMEKYSTSKLIWSAPGYVGYEEGGVLTEQVRRKPYSVVLFDEIEKANPDVLNVLLQIMDEWHIKDNKWRRIDFKNTIIILTSNIGSEYFADKITQFWFGTSQWHSTNKQDYSQVTTKVLAEVKDFLAPELVNRLSAQIVFNPLSKEIFGEILRRELQIHLDLWKWKQSIKLPKYTKTKITAIVDQIYNPIYGARPIHRYIHDEVESALIEQVISLGE